jgi:hypothetical protein
MVETKTLISGGLKIGWSTDMDAAVFANILGIHWFLNFQILIMYMTMIQIPIQS